MLLLASQSPRRRELMERMGLAFTVRPAEIDETLEKSCPIKQAIAVLSMRKAEAVFQKAAPEDWVIASDTMVLLDGEALGKPQDEEDAFTMLKALSGRTHEVVTSVTLYAQGYCDTQLSVTEVSFRALTDGEIKNYIASGEPMDKAGAYGIQGKGALLVQKINGDFYGVMGFPLCLVGEMFRRAGLL